MPTTRQSWESTGAAMASDAENPTTCHADRFKRISRRSTLHSVKTGSTRAARRAGRQVLQRSTNGRPQRRQSSSLSSPLFDATLLLVEDAAHLAHRKLNIAHEQRTVTTIMSRVRAGLGGTITNSAAVDQFWGATPLPCAASCGRRSRAPYRWRGLHAAPRAWRRVPFTMSSSGAPPMQSRKGGGRERRSAELLKKKTREALFLTKKRPR